MEEGYVAEVALHSLAIVGETVVVAEPEHIPGHVAEGQGIYLAGGGGDGLVHEACYLLELAEVSGAAGKVQVSQHQQGIVVVGCLRKFEINFLGGVGICLEFFPEAGEYAVERCFVAAGDGHEDHLPFLVGLQAVVAVGVGLYYVDTVGNQDILDAVAVAGYLAEHVGRGLGGLFDGNGFAAVFVGEYYIAAPGLLALVGFNVELEAVVGEGLGRDVGNPFLGSCIDVCAHVGVSFGHYDDGAAFCSDGDGGFSKQQGSFLLLGYLYGLGVLFAGEGDGGGTRVVVLVLGGGDGNGGISCLAAAGLNAEPAFAGSGSPGQCRGECGLLAVGIVGKDDGRFAFKADLAFYGFDDGLVFIASRQTEQN